MSKLSFKAFIAEDTMQSKVIALVRQLLDTKDFLVTNHPDENIIKRGERTAHKFLDTSGGPWVVEVFTYQGNTVARATPPKIKVDIPMYFVPKSKPVEESANPDKAYLVIGNYGKGDQTLWPSSAKPELYSKDEAEKIAKQQHDSRTKISTAGPIRNPHWHVKHIAKAGEFISHGQTAYDGYKKLMQQHEDINEETEIFAAVGAISEARMQNVIGTIYSSKQFSFKNKTFTAEISSVRGVMKQLWNDSADIGFGIKSAETENVALFILHKEHKDGEGDITHWEFHVHNPKRDPKLNGLKATIFND